ncbi:MAG: polysaccharide deacetylase family protein, partial [Rectinemataceae bacterium]|nr:polysaccharide deacetylase family protein [Rectinemataceae bacterium]
IEEAMKPIIKIVIAAVLYYTGVELLLRKLWPRKGVAIFMFHSVQPPSSITRLAGFCIDPQIFEKQIRFLSRYNCVSMSAVAAAAAGNAELPRDAIAITFDDGYADNYYVAYPILKKYGLSSTIYLTTNFIGTDQWLPLNRLYDAVERTEAVEVILPSELGLRDGRPFTLGLNTENDKQEAVTYIRSRLKLIQTDEFERIVDLLCTQLLGKMKRARSEEFKMLSWQEVRAMQDLVEYGSHTMSHCIVSKVSEERLRQELKASKFEIEKHTHKTVVHFAYPNGRREDYDERAMTFLNDMGYRTAVTTVHGVNTSISKPFELRRLTMEEPRCVIALELLGIFVTVRQWLRLKGWGLQF